MSATLFGRYDASALAALLDEYGVFDVTARRGFLDEQVEIDVSSGALSHIRVRARKGDQRYLLLDACLTETVIPQTFFEQQGFAGASPVSLMVVYWCREQDPTASFSPDRPQLPLQEHPGLGVLRRVFRIAKRMADELGKDGLASMPKFYHDAVIFFRSRLFLFVDSAEQGRFEALLRDLSGLSLREATLAVTAGCVFDSSGRPFRWAPGFQAYPIGAGLSEYFNSARYGDAVKAGAESASFTFDAEGLATAREVYSAGIEKKIA